MKQCENCIYKKHKEELLCCQIAKNENKINKIYQAIPVLGKYIDDYECKYRLEEGQLW